MTIVAPTGNRKSWYYDIQIKGGRYCKGGFPTKADAQEAEKILKERILGWKKEGLYEKATYKRALDKTNTSKIGDRTEGVILAAFLSLGKTVLLPFGNSHRYDMVVEVEGDFVRIQCKTGRLANRRTTIEFNAISKKYGTSQPRSYIGDIDCFAVYCPPTKGIYIVPIEIIKNGRGVLKLSKPSQIASDQEIYAEDCEIGKFTINGLKK